MSLRRKTEELESYCNCVTFHRCAFSFGRKKALEDEKLEERKMHTMPGLVVEPTPVSPRARLEQQLAVVEAKARDLAQRHGRLATGIALGAAAAFALGMLVYRRRGRKSMKQRAQRAIANSLWDMPEELIAQLKKRARA